MRWNTVYSLLLSVSLGTFLIPVAHAARDADAVLATCGAPESDIYSKSAVTDQPERTLTYGSLRLDFTPASVSTTNGGWVFRSAWSGNLPQTRAALARKMPCFAEALTEAQNAVAHPTLGSDSPIILQQAAAAATEPIASGIAHLWLILFFAGVIAIFAVAVPRKKVFVSRPALEKRPFRRPQLGLNRLRRRSAKTTLPSQL